MNTKSLISKGNVIDMLTYQKIKAAHRSGLRWETLLNVKRRIHGSLTYWRAQQTTFMERRSNPLEKECKAIEKLTAKPFLCRDEVYRAVKDLWDVLEDGEQEVLENAPYFHDGSHEQKDGERG